MSSLPHSSQAIEASTTQQPGEVKEASLNEGFGGKTSSIDGGGLRSPLEDADIFNTLFSKWGSDEAMEVSSVRGIAQRRQVQVAVYWAKVVVTPCLCMTVLSCVAGSIIAAQLRRCAWHFSLVQMPLMIVSKWQSIT